MLTLKDIRKDYVAGDMTVHALRGVSISFRENEFVSVLGPSGCGKTTLLNIVGGLDQYTDGDLVINGRSTKEYKDRDWDTYRNHTIGFVFQTYNLIPHQSVLANVELALTISGVGKAERRERAIRVLERVGLGDQINKKPNQMSGGQMQRVAIARALINDPDILLADEPTGALDSVTSVQIMELLQEIAKDKLVVMVTHNAELAERYSTRIVRLLDGEIIGDSDPFSPEGAEPPREDTGKKKPSMSFATALSLSFNNLKTKKGRTILTAFAGSIGIIGIALILSLSNGIQTYIDQVQEDTLSTYPLAIEAEAADLSSMIEAMAGAGGDGGEHERDAVYSNVILYDLMDSITSMDTETNDLRSFKEFLDANGGGINEYTSAIQYVYEPNFDIYTQDDDGNVVKSDVVTLLNELLSGMYGVAYTDVIQGIILLIVIGVVLPFGALDKTGGFEGLKASLDPDYFVFKPDISMIGYTITSLLYFVAGPPYWQRAFAAKSSKSATEGSLGGNIIIIFYTLAVVLIGICAASMYPGVSDSDTELVMLMMTEEYFPPIIYALTIAAILAVIMSTTDSYLILSAQTVTTDIVCRVKGIKSQKEVVLISRISVVAVGVFALLYALKMSNIFESMMLSMTQFSAGIAVPALAALFSKRVTRQGMLASMISGLAFSVIWATVLNNPWGLSEAISGSVVSLIVIVAVSACTQKSSEPAPFFN